MTQTSHIPATWIFQCKNATWWLIFFYLFAVLFAVHSRSHIQLDFNVWVQEVDCVAVCAADLGFDVAL